MDSDVRLPTLAEMYKILNTEDAVFTNFGGLFPHDLKEKSIDQSFSGTFDKEDIKNLISEMLYEISEKKLGQIVNTGNGIVVKEIKGEYFVFTKFVTSPNIYRVVDKYLSNINVLHPHSKIHVRKAWLDDKVKYSFSDVRGPDKNNTYILPVKVNSANKYDVSDFFSGISGRLREKKIAGFQVDEKEISADKGENSSLVKVKIYFPQDEEVKDLVREYFKLYNIVHEDDLTNQNKKVQVIGVGEFEPYERPAYNGYNDKGNNNYKFRNYKGKSFRAKGRRKRKKW